MPGRSKGLEASRPAGLILAGGLARRLGGVDKTLLRLGQTTALEHLVGRLTGQCGALAISANGDPLRFQASRLPILADEPGPLLGPLSGVLAGLDWLSTVGPVPWLLTVPGDTPFVPLDLASALQRAAAESGAPVARIIHAGRLHPLVALWSLDLRHPLRAALHHRDLRKVTAFQAEVGVADLTWPETAPDPFFNINTPDDLAEARRIAAFSLDG